MNSDHEPPLGNLRKAMRTWRLSSPKVRMVEALPASIAPDARKDDTLTVGRSSRYGKQGFELLRGAVMDPELGPH